MMKIEIINECPVCNEKLTRVKDQLFCRNSDCSAVTAKQVQAFAKVLKIKGLGERTVEKLGFRSIRDIYGSTEDFLTERLGERMGRKLYTEIEGSREVPLSVFLSALSIPLVGSTAAKKISSCVPSLDEINEETCKQAGLGPTVTENLLEWIENERSLPQELGITLVSELNSSTPDLDITVCVTGKIEGYTRDSIRSYLNSFGVKTVDSVNNKTDILICNDINSTNSKAKKARELGIEIMTFNEFKEILND